MHLAELRQSCGIGDGRNVHIQPNPKEGPLVFGFDKHSPKFSAIWSKEVIRPFEQARLGSFGQGQTGPERKELITGVLQKPRKIEISLRALPHSAAPSPALSLAFRQNYGSNGRILPGS